uniref:Remorin n=1 Tax=Anthurium amnicola TaxID=1678845 RepID=A0A1D1XLC5_9ARAE
MSVRSRSGTFPSPGTPNYCHGGGGGAAGYQKGWSSERVPLPANSGRRCGNGSALLPFSNGRALPSKWEDAEKWILSPVSGEGAAGRTWAPPPPNHRRPKSKSGPLGAPVGMSSNYSSAASPLMPVTDRRKMGDFTVSSPFLTGVLLPERRCCESVSSGKCGSGCEGVVGVRDGGRRSYSAHPEQGIVRSASVHGWSDLLIESSSSFASSQDEKLEGTKGSTTMISSVILRKDVATQMSPEHSTQTSPKEGSNFAPSPISSTPAVEEFQSPISNLEFRDVQVDDRVTLTRWSKKHIARGTDRCSANIIQWKKKTVESRASSWEVAETAKCISKFKREEAKITAWENLQKAKAEAEIRKLEMKLEKMRSSSMDKILNKLRSAQRKAQDKRNAVTSSLANHNVRAAKNVSSCRKAGQGGSLSGCFTCHAF